MLYMAVTDVFKVWHFMTAFLVVVQYSLPFITSDILQFHYFNFLIIFCIDLPSVCITLYLCSTVFGPWELE